MNTLLHIIASNNNLMVVNIRWIISRESTIKNKKYIGIDMKYSKGVFALFVGYWGDKFTTLQVPNIKKQTNLEWSKWKTFIFKISFTEDILLQIAHNK